jgi:hypothetical protein
MWQRRRQLCKCGHAKSFHRMSAPHRRNASTCNFGECKCREFRPTNSEQKATVAQNADKAGNPTSNSVVE